MAPLNRLFRKTILVDPWADSREGTKKSRTKTPRMPQIRPRLQMQVLTKAHSRTCLRKC